MIFTVSLLFSDTLILASSLHQCEKTRTIKHSPHFILDDHYPLRRAANAAALQVLAAKNPTLVLVDSGHNRGLHHGFNYLMEQVKPTRDDYIIVVDPDCFPLDTGWDTALVEALRGDDQLAYVGLSSKVTYEGNGTLWQATRSGGIDVMLPNRAQQFNITAWKASFLLDVGWWEEPTNFYGHLESAMWAKKNKMHKTMGYLPKFTEDFRLVTMHDPSFQEYKREHAAFRYQGSFTEYVKEKGIR